MPKQIVVKLSYKTFMTKKMTTKLVSFVNLCNWVIIEKAGEGAGK